MTKYIGVISGKGGVGKTTVAINVAVALSLLGRDVVLADADLSKPNVSVHLGAHRFSPTLHDVLLGQKPLKEAVYYHQSGLRFIPGGISSYHARQSSPELMKSIPEHTKNIAEAVVFDGPLSDPAMVEAFLSFVDETIVVTTPDLLAISDTLRVLHLAEQSAATPIGVVINRAHFNEFEVSKETVQTMLGLPVLGEIPEHMAVRESLKKEQPLVTHDPSCAVSKEFKKVASLIIGEEYHAFVKEHNT